MPLNGRSEQDFLEVPSSKFQASIIGFWLYVWERERFLHCMASDSGKEDVPTREVVVRTFSTREQADLAVAQLEANGIATRISADDGGGIMPYLTQAQGVRVFVSEADAAAARELLNLPPVSSPDSSPRLAPCRSKLAIGQIIAGIIVGILGTLVYQSVTRPTRVTHSHQTAAGKIDEEWVYEKGILREHRSDRGLKGRFDRWSYYDARGNLERVEVDNNFDGRPDEWWFYSGGVVYSGQKDCDFNGIPDEFYTYKDGIIQEVDMRPNGSHFTTIRELYVNGVFSEIWRGGDADGLFTEIVKYNALYEPISTNSGVFKLSSVHNSQVN
jgi:hypothetical protein